MDVEVQDAPHSERARQEGWKSAKRMFAAMGLTLCAIGYFVASSVVAIHDSAAARAVARQIEHEQALPGAAPLHSQARSYHGRTVYVVAAGDAFAVIAPGVDGKPDRTDWAEVVARSDVDPQSTCLMPWRDAVATPDGLLRGCEK